ncbi:MAG: BolA family transcriptional regulator [Acidiferrobacteraceae bacterium]
MSDRIEQIEQRLRAALDPESLDIEDDSHLHAGHAGARGGAGHYGVMIVSKAFSGLGTVERHRLVYDAVRDMMPAEIHALRISAHAPDEI